MSRVADGTEPPDVTAAPEFGRLVAACVQRFLAQNRCAPLAEAELSTYTRSLAKVVREEGIPPPLRPDEDGQPAEMPAARAAALVDRVLAPLPRLVGDESVDTLTRQLIKACLQPHFRQCRESYRAMAGGVCRRQERTRAIARVSGSHCVDCPYWLELDADEHEAFLAAAWQGGPVCELHDSFSIFLPEDFRRLRKHLSGEAHS